MNRDYEPKFVTCLQGDIEWICAQKIDSIIGINCECGRYRCCLETSMADNGGAILLLVWLGLTLTFVFIIAIWAGFTMTRKKVLKRALREKQLSKLSMYNLGLGNEEIPDP